jgi:predicted nucleic acid-binding Zn ribbon protein
MPKYDYKCCACGGITELSKGINDSTIYGWCRKCFVKTFLIRKFTPSGNFVLKGAGWYKSDYGVRKQKEEE